MDNFAREVNALSIFFPKDGLIQERFKGCKGFKLIN